MSKVGDSLHKASEYEPSKGVESISLQKALEGRAFKRRQKGEPSIGVEGMSLQKEIKEEP